MRIIGSVGLVLFYGLIGLLLCYGIYYSTQKGFLGKEQFLFIFFLVFSYYYYLQIYNPNVRKFNSFFLSLPLVIGVGICVLIYWNFKWADLNSNLLMLEFTLALLYGIPHQYLNLRQIPFLKNILVALVWVLMPWIFISFKDVNPTLVLLTMEFFAFIFLISMKFDEIDHEVDLRSKHITASAILSKQHSNFIILVGSSVIIILDVLMWKFLYLDRNKMVSQLLINLLLIYFLLGSVKGIQKYKITFDTILLMKVVCLCLI
jgi:hypothetical protein